MLEDYWKFKVLSRIIWLTEGGADEIPENAYDIMMQNIQKNDRLQTALKCLKPNSLHFECPMYEAFVTLADAPDIKPFGECNIHIYFVNKYAIHENVPYILSLRWILPEGFSVKSGRSTLRIEHISSHSKDHCGKLDVVISAGEMVQPTNRLVLEVVAEGRPTVLYIPITLLG